MTVALVSRSEVRPDGSSRRGGSVGAIDPGADTGVGRAIGRRRAPEGGRYALERHTRPLTGSRRRSRRLFFAYGPRKGPSGIDREMIVVGDDVLTPAGR